MIIEEAQAINSFLILESSKEVYALIWLLVPILTLVLEIIIGILLIYVGPLGILQSPVDGVKLFFKKDLLPSRGDICLFSVGPSVAVVSILLSYSVIPFGYHLVLTDLSIGVSLWIAISSIAPIRLLMSEYRSNNKYSFLGGLRAAVQSISYEILLTLCVLSISLLWFLGVESLASTYRVYLTVLYLGGWNLPIPYIPITEPFEINQTSEVFGTTISLFITLAKAYLFMFIPISTRWTLPRLRMDRLLNIGWKSLLPIALGNLLLTTSCQLVSL
ncbi:unnamed protein product [Victoria cruziana]